MYIYRFNLSPCSVYNYCSSLKVRHNFILKNVYNFWCLSLASWQRYTKKKFKNKLNENYDLRLLN